MMKINNNIMKRITLNLSLKRISLITLCTYKVISLLPNHNNKYAILPNSIYISSKNTNNIFEYAIFRVYNVVQYKTGAKMLTFSNG